MVVVKGWFLHHSAGIFPMNKGLPLLTWRLQLRPHPALGSANPAATQAWEAATLDDLLDALRSTLTPAQRNLFDGEVDLHVWEGVDTPPAGWLRLQTFAARHHLEGLIEALGSALTPAISHPAQGEPEQQWTFQAWAGTDLAPIGWGRHSLHIVCGGWRMCSACAARLALQALGRRADPATTPDHERPVLRPRDAADAASLPA